MPTTRSSSTPGPRLRDRLRRRFLIHRRSIAALLAAVGVFAILQSVAPPPPATTPVVVAVRPVTLGTRLQAADMQVRQFPTGLAPAGAQVSVADLTGSRISTRIEVGEPVTEARLVSAAVTPDPEAVLMPLRLTDADTVRLLSPGDLVDVLGTDPESGAVATLATGVPIVTVPRVPRSGGGLSPGGLVIVAVPSSGVRPLTAAAARQVISVVWAR